VRSARWNSDRHSPKKLSVFAGGSAPILLNAANEVAVASFLDRRLAFDRIPGLVEEVLDRVAAARVGSLEDVLAADALGRRAALQKLETVAH